MEEDRFWAIVDSVRHGVRNSTEISEALTAALTDLSTDELVSFDQHWHAAYQRADTWAVWASSVLLFGSMGDDGFMDFRNWLISQGRVAFDNAVRDPDTLAALAGDVDDEFDESLGSEALDLYERRTGRPLKVPPDDSSGFGEEELDLDDDAAVAARFPRLFAHYRDRWAG